MTKLSDDLEQAYEAHKKAETTEELKNWHEAIGNLLYGHIPAIIAALRSAGE